MPQEYAQLRINHYTEENETISESIAGVQEDIETMERAIHMLERADKTFKLKRNPARRALERGIARSKDEKKSLQWTLSVNNNTLKNLRGE